MKRAIIYIRVSTDEQAEKGTSLAHQEERVRQYCLQNDIAVIRIFKEDYSAKTFERPVFTELLKYCQERKSSIEYLLILKWDRFSRNTTESFKMIDQFNKLDIEIQAIEQPLDLAVPENKIMLAFYLTSPEVENMRRSLNVKSGMKQRLKAGIWMGPLPVGYKKDKNSNKVELSDNAKYILMAFDLLCKGFSMTEIKESISKQGFHRNLKTWSKILRNPFYAGIIKHGLLIEPVNGVHPPLISKSLFDRVQQILSGKKKGRAFNDFRYPFKRLIKCEKCGQSLSGYIVKRKRKHYYKCPTIGCRTNIAETKLQNQFFDLLIEISIDEQVAKGLRKSLQALYSELTRDRLASNQNLKTNLAAIKERLEKLELKYIDGQIDIEFYQKHSARFATEIRTINNEIESNALEASNFEKYFDFALTISRDMPQLWEKAEPLDKEKLFSLIFPEGLMYDKETNQLRTPRLNEIFKLINSISDDYKQKTEFPNDGNSALSPLVVRTGIEPVLPE